EGSSDRFGRSVSLSSDGNTVAVGAPFNDGNLNATESIAVIESLLATGNRGESSGDAGNLIINTKNLIIDNLGFIGSTSFGVGKAGNIQINAVDSIELIPGEFLISSDVRLAEFNLNTNINSSTLTTADAGNIEINTQQLIVRENTLISASTVGIGKGGNLTINAGDVQVFGDAGESFGGLATASDVDATGDGGNLVINANTLKLQSGKISAGTVGIGEGGNLLINVNNLQVENGGNITVSTAGVGKAGSLTVNADNIQINGVDINGFTSGFFATSGSDATGTAGDIKINTNDLQISNQGTITVEALGAGIAGNLQIVADSIFLDSFSIISGNTSSNFTETNQEQANLDLRASSLIMRQDSQITTNASGNNVIGGNITINVDILAALKNSDITANSTNFRGGNVMITSQGIVGTEFRDQLTDESDITATGVSPELSGNVQINQLSTDVTQGLFNLSSGVIDTDNQLDQGCSNGGDFANGENKLTIIGRGGLPDGANDLLTATNPLVDLVEVETMGENNKDELVETHLQSSQIQVIEAQGWLINETGKVKLVANQENTSSNSYLARDNYCVLSE
ncbi:MAG: hypothetical protein F6K62_18785, partial [Sphaerospermopsis sp. SIO1G2]|nr:hypothetical protein [Sphaerospermopsis sp. SIO1G2]